MANGHRHSCRPTCLLCRRLNWTERLFSFERMVWYWRSTWLVYAKLICASQCNCLFIIYYFVQIRTLFSRGAVLIFSWLQERSSAKNDVQTAVPSSCNERTSFRTMTVFSFGIRTSFRPFERFCSVRTPRTAFERPFFSIIFTGVTLYFAPF